MNNRRRFRRSIHVRHGRPKKKRGPWTFAMDVDSPLVQPTIHAVAEGQLEPGLLLSAGSLMQEGIDLLQQTQGAVSAVTRSATRERARPLRNSTRTARDTTRGTAENTISPANSPGTEEKDEIAPNS